MKHEPPEFINWAKRGLAGYPEVACITLNFKQGLQLPYGWVRLTPQIASQQVEWLLRNVDRAV